MCHPSGPTLDEEAVDGAVLAVLEQRVAGGFTEGGEVGHRAGVGGEHLELGAHGQLGERLARLEDRQRTGKSLQIERFVGHRGPPATATRCLYQPGERAGNDGERGLDRTPRHRASACAGPAGGPRCDSGGHGTAGLGGMMDATADAPRRSFAFGLERLGLVGLGAPTVTVALVLVLSGFAAWGLSLLRVDDSLSELFRSDTEEFRRYEEIDRRFPSSEYDVLVVVEGKDLLKKPQLEAFRRAIVDLQLADGVDGLISMLSARGKPDASGYAPPIVPDDLPDGPAYDAIIEQLRANDIVKGKFLSPDGQLALAVIALDRKAVQQEGARAIIGGIGDLLRQELAPVGLKTQL